MKLYETYMNSNGFLEPLRINGRTYNQRTSKLICYSLNEPLTNIYQKKNGEYWIHVMVSGIGHYIAPLSEKEAKLRIYMIKNGGIS